MTPQERQLLDELFDRLAKLEGAPRDADAIRAINDGLTRAPNAMYALVQSVLVQDEALKQADARIQDLEAQLGGEQPAAAPQGGFLDTMRDAMFGRNGPQGSVPTVKPAASPWNTPQAPQQSPWSNAGGGNASYAPPPGYAPAPGQPPAVGAPGGGSFLGTAASAAAGMVAGSLLLNSFRSMFGGGQHQGQAFGANPDSGSGSWGPTGGDNSLSRQAGIDDIGGSRTSAYDDQGGSQRSGLFDLAQQDADDDDDADSDDDMDFDDDVA